MKFTMPETLDGLSLEQLEELYAAAFEEYAGLAAKDDADVTDGDIADIDALGQHLATIEAAQDTVTAGAQERADKLAAARSKVAEASTPAEDPEDDEDGDEEGDGEGDDDEPADEPEAVEEEKELVTASATPRRRVVSKAASKTPAPREVIPAPQGAVLIAAANLPNIEAKHAFANLSEASQTWGAFASKGAGGSSTAMINYDDIAMVDPQRLSKNKQQLGFMRIQKPANEFGITEGMSVQQQLDIIDAAANERTKFGSGGLARAILAAAGGGWCAPSETVYDFCSYETVSGILDVPTINMPRGGIKYSKGPDYATLAATWGFIQTETQADASTAKVCYPVACPPFLETRLDAIGFCVTAGVLTNTTYPELIRRVLEIGTVAHAHKVNAYVIGKISTAIGAAINHLETGGTISDVLDAIDLQAQRIRYQLAMAENATLEVVLPVWAKSILRADLGRRTGINELGVTDAQLQSYFAVRGVRVQWVFDYQPLDSTSTTTWTKFPAALEFMMYPAGAFVKGALPVIDLDTIYDSVGLSTNTYTAAFFEEGVQVFNRCGFGVKASVDITKLSGRTGAHDITP